MIYGIKKGDKEISVQHLPDRKKPCLVCQQGNRGIIVATFRSEEEVELFGKYLMDIIGKEEAE